MFSWFLYLLILFIFYLFTSPFIENRELRNKFNRSYGYVYFSLLLWLWLSIAVLYHISDIYPKYWKKENETSMNENNSNGIPLSLIFPIHIMTSMILLIFEYILNNFRKLIVYNVSISRDIIETLQTSLIISIITVLIYTQCNNNNSDIINIDNINSIKDIFLSTWSKDNEILIYEQGSICQSIILGTSQRHVSNPWMTVWITVMAISMINFVYERFVGVRGIFSVSLPMHSSNIEHNVFVDHSLSTIKYAANAPMNSTLFENFVAVVSENLHGEDFIQRPPGLKMVNWYSLFQSPIFVDMGISFKIFLGRFDIRELQAALRPTNNPPRLPSAPLLDSEELKSPCVNTKNILEDVNKKYNFAHLSPKNFLNLEEIEKLPSFLSTEEDNVEKELWKLGVHDQYAYMSELWFDFMADCGDGWNSSYSVSRALAQPSLNINIDSSIIKNLPDKFKSKASIDLPRGKSLILGGDLAYPAPSEFSWEKRFFMPFQDSLVPPPHYQPEAVSLYKPDFTILNPFFAYPNERYDNNVIKDTAMNDLPRIALHTYNGPTCYAIPGNHDWFDGLELFIRKICNRDWLGGWLLPQSSSYFALKFPHGWWLFGVDKALNKDIDSHQLKYFARISQLLSPTDRVILVSHEPQWILDPQEHTHTELNLTYLIQTYLKEKLLLRLNGDLHNYTRHSPSTLNNKTGKQMPHFLVSGGGGAFLHPTHIPNPPVEYEGVKYEREIAYPPPDLTYRMAWVNILGFRRRNWRFDILGAIFYFLVVFSLIPLCSNHVKSIFTTFSSHRPILDDFFIYFMKAINFEDLSNLSIRDSLNVIDDTWIFPILRYFGLLLCGDPSYESTVSLESYILNNLFNWERILLNFIKDVTLTFTEYSFDPALQPYFIIIAEYTESIIEVSNFLFAFFYTSFWVCLSIIKEYSAILSSFLGFLAPFYAAFKPFIFFGFTLSYFSFNLILAFICDILKLYVIIFEKTYVSAIVIILSFFALYGLADSHLSFFKRFTFGFLHMFAHTFSALGILMLLEIGIEVGLRYGVLGNASMSLWHVFIQNYPTFSFFLDKVDGFSFGIFSTILKSCMNLFDIPEIYALHRVASCAGDALGRSDILALYGSFLLYFWILSTPMASFIFGSYLSISVNLLDSHFTEAFSSLRVEDYKNFLRLHIKPTGDLEIFALGLDQVALEWVADPLWTGFLKKGVAVLPPSFHWKKPSKWKPKIQGADNKGSKWKLVDYLVISKPKKTVRINSVSKNNRPYAFPDSKAQETTIDSTDTSSGFNANLKSRLRSKVTTSNLSLGIKSSKN